VQQRPEHCTGSTIKSMTRHINPCNRKKNPEASSPTWSACASNHHLQFIKQCLGWLCSGLTPFVCLVLVMHLGVFFLVPAKPCVAGCVIFVTWQWNFFSFKKKKMFWKHLKSLCCPLTYNELMWTMGCFTFCNFMLQHHIFFNIGSQLDVVTFLPTESVCTLLVLQICKLVPCNWFFNAA